MKLENIVNVTIPIAKDVNMVIDISGLLCPFTLMKLKMELTKIVKNSDIEILFTGSNQPLKNLSDCLIEEDCRPGKIKLIKDDLFSLSART